MMILFLLESTEINLYFDDIKLKYDDNAFQSTPHG